MKKAFILILALALAATSVISASAGKTVLRSGDWLLERINDGASFEIDEYIGSDAEITLIGTFIDIPVTDVGESAFANNLALVTLNGGDTVSRIDKYAFSGCTSLSTVSLPASVSYLGVGAFANCFALNEINLSDTSLTDIPNYCFTYAGFTELALPESCVSIGYSSFQHCEKLEKITIPASVTAIADNAFEGCDKLVIYTVTGAYAAEYAEAHGIPYVLTDAPEQPGERYLLGDADGDGEVTILDATKIQRVLVGLDSDDGGRVTMRGDTNRDGLDILDATKIQRFLADFTVTEPIGEYFDTNVLC